MRMPEAVTIRRAVREDARAIARVHVDSWRTTYRGIVPEEHIAHAPMRSVRRCGIE
jgi:hypothetical protein